MEEKNDGGGLQVSQEEAIDALHSSDKIAKAVAIRAKRDEDNSALLIIGQVDKGDTKAVTSILIGKGGDIIEMLAEQLPKVPKLREILKRVLLADMIK